MVHQPSEEVSISMASLSPFKKSVYLISKTLKLRSVGQNYWKYVLPDDDRIFNTCLIG